VIIINEATPITNYSHIIDKRYLHMHVIGFTR